MDNDYGKPDVLDEQIDKDAKTAPKYDYEFFVAGVKFHSLKSCINEVKQGDVLTLVPEPSNRFDPNAVRLEFYSLHQETSIMVGYVPAKISASVAGSLVVNELKAEVLEINPKAVTHEQLKIGITEV